MISMIVVIIIIIVMIIIVSINQFYIQVTNSLMLIISFAIIPVCIGNLIIIMSATVYYVLECIV